MGFVCTILGSITPGNCNRKGTLAAVRFPSSKGHCLCCREGLGFRVKV